MSEHEPQDEKANEIEQVISRLIEIIETKESYSGHLEEEDKLTLIDSIRNINVLDSRSSADEEVHDREYFLDDEEFCNNLYALLEEFGIDAEQALREVGLIE